MVSVTDYLECERLQHLARDLGFELEATHPWIILLPNRERYPGFAESASYTARSVPEAIGWLRGFRDALGFLGNGRAG